MDIKKIWTFERLILIIFILAISISVLMFTLLFPNLFVNLEFVHFIMWYFGCIGLSFVIVIIIAYYLVEMIGFLKKGNYLYLTIILIFGGGWSIFGGLKEKSWLALFGNLFFVALIVCIERFIVKRQDKKKIKSKKK